MWGRSGPEMQPKDPQDAAASPWQPSKTLRRSPPALQLTLPGTTDAVRCALQEILASDLLAGFSADLRSSAEIVLAEVLNNIVEHAYAAHAGAIRLTLFHSETGLACKVTDCGAAMPGLCLPKGDFQPLGPTPDLPEGGFGWFLIRSLVTGLRYHRSDGENRLSFVLPSEQS